MKSTQIYQVWVNGQPMYTDILMNLAQAINAFTYYKNFIGYKDVKIVDTTIKEK